MRVGPAALPCRADCGPKLNRVRVCGVLSAHPTSVPHSYHPPEVKAAGAPQSLGQVGAGDATNDRQTLQHWGCFCTARAQHPTVSSASRDQVCIRKGEEGGGGGGLKGGGSPYGPRRRWAENFEA